MKPNCPQRLFALRAIATATALCAAPVVAQDTWISTRVQTPTKREDAAIAFDPIQNVTVMFGGHVTTASAFFITNETWIYDGKSWTTAFSFPTPQPTWRAAMAFDEKRGVLVLFGGITNKKTRSRDTWELDGKSWKFKGAVGVNDGRYLLGMAYDPNLQMVIRFGGGGAGGATGETAGWNGSFWTRLATTGPSPREEPWMVTDPDGKRVILFGGINLNDTWSWDGKLWTKLNPAVSPPPSEWYRMTYQKSNARVLLQGTKTWVFKGNTWRELSPTLQPGYNHNTAFAYDSKRDVAVYVKEAVTYEFKSGVAVLASAVKYGKGCKGPQGVPDLAPLNGDAPYIGELFELRATGLPTGLGHPVYAIVGASRNSWNGFPLPLSLNALGMTGCDLNASLDVMFGLVSNGGVADWASAVPYVSALVGRTAALQVWVLDTRANPGSVLTSNGVDCRIGSR